MKIYHFTNINAQPLNMPNMVLTIGNFDGVHLGHQKMLQKVIDIAKKNNLQSCVMTFEPQPKEFFHPQTAPARLSSLSEKIILMEKFGIDHLWVVDFNEDFRQLSAQDFAIRLQQWGVKHFVLGDDFRFGHDRMGDGLFLQKFGFLVDYVATCTDQSLQNQRISSTKIREYLLAGDIKTANQLLGYPYYIIGQVQHGDKIGRSLDFPTANIGLNRLRPALHGVFAVDVLSDDGQDLQRLAENGQIGLTGLHHNSLFGAASIGVRPSIQQIPEWRLEVFLPEFVGNLYGQNLKIVFNHFLHGERHYPNLSALQSGIAEDVNDLLCWRQSTVSKW